MNNSNNNKNKFLGIPYGTACYKLRKMIMFDLVKQLNKNFCYRCKERIEHMKDFSIDHKKCWLGVNKELFWDLNNIAFSHLRCNISHGSRDRKYNGNKDEAWCYGCHRFLIKDKFSNNSTRWNKVDCECKSCKSIRVKKAKWDKRKKMPM